MPSAATQDLIACECSACGKRLKAPARFAGRDAPCPACKAPIHVPAPEEPELDLELDFGDAPPAVAEAPAPAPVEPTRHRRAGKRRSSGARKTRSGGHRTRSSSHRSASGSARAGGPDAAPGLDERVGFGPRLGAWAIDVAIVTVLSCVGGAIVGGLFGAALMVGPLAPLAAFGGTIVGVVVASLVVPPLYQLVQVATAATPGKMLLGLQIGHVDGFHASSDQLAQRYLVMYSPSLIALLALYIPFIGVLGSLAGLALFFGCFLVLGASRQALHDNLVGTAVFRSEDLQRAWGPRRDALSGLALPVMLIVPLYALGTVGYAGYAMASAASEFEAKMAEAEREMKEAHERMKTMQQGGASSTPVYVPSKDPRHFVRNRLFGPAVRGKAFFKLAESAGLGDRINNFKRVSSGVTTMGHDNDRYSISTLERVYKTRKDAPESLNLTLIDCGRAPDEKVAELAPWRHNGLVRGQPGAWQGNKVSILVAGRFIIILEGNGLNRMDMQKALGALRPNALATYARQNRD